MNKWFVTFFTILLGGSAATIPQLQELIAAYPNASIIVITCYGVAANLAASPLRRT